MKTDFLFYIHKLFWNWGFELKNWENLRTDLSGLIHARMNDYVQNGYNYIHQGKFMSQLGLI